MRFGGRLSRTAFVHLIDENHDRIRRSARLLPLYGLADWSGLRMIGQWGWSGDVLDRVGLAFRTRTGTGPWAEITTTAVSGQELVVEQRTAIALATPPVQDGETYQRILDAVTAERPAEVSIEVDGVSRTFQYWPESALGPDDHRCWYAALPEVPGLVVTASGIEPGEARLVTVADVEPYLLATREHLIAEYDAASPSDQL